MGCKLIGMLAYHSIGCSEIQMCGCDQRGVGINEAGEISKVNAIYGQSRRISLSVLKMLEPIEIVGCHGTGSCRDRDLLKDWPQRRVLSFGHG